MATTPTEVPPDGGGGGGGGGAPPPRYVDDRYEVLSTIGSGGMGIVHSARDRLTNDIVALKQITSGAAGTAPGAIGTTGRDHGHQRRLALAREFRTLATLRHPNIISVLDYGFRGGEPFFTMELLDRPRTLLEAAKGLSERDRVHLLIDVLRALSYVHRRGVLHRDLTPRNVLVDTRVRVLDCGIAIHRDEGSAGGGTLSHMAPEVILGEPATEATDLYAVGVMACQLLAGHHPFAGFLDDALRRAVLEREPELDELARAPALQRAVAGLLAREPADRPRTADAAIDELIAAAQLDIPRHTRATRESFLQAAGFVGREGERAVLGGALQRLMTEDRGGLWLIEGQSGIGKTRLLDELRTLALVGGAKVVRGQADSAAAGALDLWREPLRHLLLGTDLPDDQLRPLRALVLDLEQLLRRPIGDAPPNLPTARDDLMRAIRAVFERQRTPVVLILEDLHWARESLDVLQALEDELGAMRVLVIGSYRGEEARVADELCRANHLRLGPLSPEQIAALAHSMFPRVTPNMITWLEQNTAGNAFILVESVREHAESKGSLERAGQEVPDGPITSAAIDEIVARRLALVPADIRPVLAFAAVAGHALDPALLDHQFGAVRLADALAIGDECAVLVVSDSRYRFAHDRFRQYTLDVLAPERRRELHAEVAAAIEQVHGTGAAWAAALAYHHGRAGHADREATFSALAGETALERGAYDEASRLFERAIELFGTQRDVAAELSALTRYGAVLVATRGWFTPDVNRVYERAVALSGRDQLPALHGLASNTLFRGQLRAAREGALLYRRLGEEIGDAAAQVEAAVTLANVATWLGDHATAAEQHDRIAALYEPEQLATHMRLYGWHPRVVGFVTDAMSTCIRGHVDRAVDLYREAIALAEPTKQPFTIAIAYQIAAWVHHLRRDIAETRAWADRLGEVANANGFPAFIVLADALGGWATVLGGDPTGLPRVRDALRRWREMGSRMVTTFYVTHLAEACLAAGEVDEAFGLLEGTLADTTTTEERCYHPELWRLLGETHRRRGERSAAVAALERARELAVEQGARLFEGRASAALTELRNFAPPTGP